MFRAVRGAAASRQQGGNALGAGTGGAVTFAMHTQGTCAPRLGKIHLHPSAACGGEEGACSLTLVTYKEGKRSTECRNKEKLKKPTAPSTRPFPSPAAGFKRHVVKVLGDMF